MYTWIEILLAYDDGKFGRYFHGLTPRLLIGANQLPLGAKFENDKIAYNVSKELFEEMRNYNEDGLIVTSNYCGIHQGPVVRLTEAEWTKDSIGISFDEIWNSYGDEIVAGEFGINSYDKQVLNSLKE